MKFSGSVLQKRVFHIRRTRFSFAHSKKRVLVNLWANGSDGNPYILVYACGICATSGSLGPKRRYGDGQVPEGFCELVQFNPQSNFFLSLHIGYPNASDRILGSNQNPGGDIYLHGNCATIGCIPITDDSIKEVCWLCLLIRASGRRHVPTYVSPAHLTDGRFKELARSCRGYPELMAFWGNLKEGFDYLEKNHQPPKIMVPKDGRYAFLGEASHKQ